MWPDRKVHEAEIGSETAYIYSSALRLPSSNHIENALSELLSLRFSQLGYLNIPLLLPTQTAASHQNILPFSFTHPPPPPNTRPLPTPHSAPTPSHTPTRNSPSTSHSHPTHPPPTSHSSAATAANSASQPACTRPPSAAARAARWRGRWRAGDRAQTPTA